MLWEAAGCATDSESRVQDRQMELSVRPDRVTIIENGAYTGLTLEDFFSKAGNKVVSEDYEGGRFRF